MPHSPLYGRTDGEVYIGDGYGAVVAANGSQPYTQALVYVYCVEDRTNH